ncbi:hypothetical protein DID99_34170 [Burkholderia sp. Bp8986]|nr:hypothetical protein DID99_34170 [Burkholderia sp. Bp8986]
MSPERMLRIYFPQEGYCQSDEWHGDQLYNSIAMRVFADTKRILNLSHFAADRAK